MDSWWIRPLVRLLAAVLLPLAVPGVLTALIWALPGDPASIICPPAICGGTAELAEKWNLHLGPWHFFSTWISAALTGDLGNSWRMQPGVPVSELIGESIPWTAGLVALAFIPLVLGATGAAGRWLSDKLDPLIRLVGMTPAVLLALLASALVTIRYGSMAFDDDAMMVKILLGALTLGLADAALSGAVIGIRGLMEDERKQRYVQIAILRGESVLANTLPNVVPAIAGQMRARLLHLLSGAVIVEVVIRIDGLGDLLWQGTLTQDFGVVLAAAFAFSVLSALLLLGQALIEIAVALHVRRSPVVTA